MPEERKAQQNNNSLLAENKGGRERCVVKLVEFPAFSERKLPNNDNQKLSMNKNSEKSDKNNKATSFEVE
eukprot:1270687-Amphidinium_carterae.1